MLFCQVQRNVATHLEDYVYQLLTPRLVMLILLLVLLLFLLIITHEIIKLLGELFEERHLS